MRYYRLLGFVLLFFLFSISAFSQAKPEEWKTVATFVFSDSDSGLEAMKEAAKAARVLKYYNFFERNVREQMEDILDFSKSKGFTVKTNGTEFDLLAFIPVSDYKRLPLGIGEKLSELEADANGWLELEPENIPFKLYFKQEKEWLFATLNPKLHETLPDDPKSCFGELEEKYLIALDIQCSNIPRSYLAIFPLLAKQWISEFETLPAFESLDLDDGSGTQITFLKKFFEVALSDLVDFVKQSESMTFGLERSRKNELVLSFKAEVTPGTELEHVLQKTAEAKTELSAFHDKDAIASVGSVIVLTRNQKREYKKLVRAYFDYLENQFGDNALPDEEQWHEVKDVLFEMFDTYNEILERTIDSGVYDHVQSITAEGIFVNALRIVDGRSFDLSVERFLESMLELVGDEIIESLGLDIEMFHEEEYRDCKVRYFEFDILKSLFGINIDGEDTDEPTEEDEEPGLHESRELKLLSNKVTVFFILGENVIADGISFDKDVLAKIKKMIDSTKTPAPAPKEFLTFSPHKLGLFLDKTVDTLKFLSDEMLVLRFDERPEFFDLLVRVPEDAKLLGTVDFGKNSIKYKIVMDAGIWPLIGYLVSNISESILGSLYLNPDDVFTVEPPGSLEEAESFEEIEAFVEKMYLDHYEDVFRSNGAAKEKATTKKCAEISIAGGEKALREFSGANDEKAYRLILSGLYTLFLAENAPLDPEERVVRYDKNNPRIKRMLSILEVLEKEKRFEHLMQLSRMEVFSAEAEEYAETGLSLEHFDEFRERAFDLLEKTYPKNHPYALLGPLVEIMNNEKMSIEDPEFQEKSMKEILDFINSDRFPGDEESAEETIEWLKNVARKGFGKKLELYGKTFDGEDFDWKSLEEKYVLVYFDTFLEDKSAFCESMNDIIEKYRNNGLKAIAFDMWDYSDGGSDDEKQKLVSFPMISERLSKESGMVRQGEFFKIHSLPLVFLLDKEGKIIGKYTHIKAVREKLETIFN